MPFQFRKEAIEEDLNTNFPSQGQGNPPLYYSLSEVVVPTYNINPAADGSALRADLQVALDFATDHTEIINTTTTIINTPGFFRVILVASILQGSSAFESARLDMTDGISSKRMWQWKTAPTGTSDVENIVENEFVFFLRSGDSLSVTSTSANVIANVSTRQIATVNGRLTNPLGFSFA